MWINNNQNHNNYDTTNNWWSLWILVLVLGTAFGNILVCLAIISERRLQNYTNYFLMSLAITDLMVAVFVMPLGILTLVTGYFPLTSIYCLIWIYLDVLFCTSSIMHLCTISIDRFLSLRYPMIFGRNKTRLRVIFKLMFVWFFSVTVSLPLIFIYSKKEYSVLVDGVCQIPNSMYKIIGSIICFYIPLIIMLITYILTVRLLRKQNIYICRLKVNSKMLLIHSNKWNNTSGYSVSSISKSFTDNESKYSLKYSSSSKQLGYNYEPNLKNITLKNRCSIINQLERKATNVLGIIFLTFVILWAPFFILNLILAVCSDCVKCINSSIFDVATWLGYSSSLVNPIIYTIFNRIFRKSFIKVLLCQYKLKANHFHH